MARQISIDAAHAFWETRDFKRSNTEVIVTIAEVQLWLFGNRIATRYRSMGRRADRLDISMCGYGTPTTRERLTTLMQTGLGANLFGGSVYQHKHEQVLCLWGKTIEMGVDPNMTVRLHHSDETIILMDGIMQRRHVEEVIRNVEVLPPEMFVVRLIDVDGYSTIETQVFDNRSMAEAEAERLQLTSWEQGLNRKAQVLPASRGTDL
jgi:hypothetical protein